MKRLGVRTSPEARSDIAAVSRWLQGERVSTRTIRLYVARIHARCRRVGDAPFGGTAHPEWGAGVRSVSFEASAIILYRVEPDHLLIPRILRRGRDVDEAVRG